MTKDTDKAGAEASAFFAATTRDDPPIWEVTLRPHRSLTNRGFVWVIGFTAVASCIPLIAFLGTYALWALLPFGGAALAFLWYAIRRSDHDGTLSETLRLWPDLIAVHRHNPRSPDQYWYANPYWVTTHLRTLKEVENYLTIKGAGREIELGRFLTPEDRVDLHSELTRRLAGIARP